MCSLPCISFPSRNRLLTTDIVPFLLLFLGITVIWSPLSDCISRECRGDVTVMRGSR